MFAHFAVLAFASAGLALGFAYRASAAVFALAFTHVFLCDQVTYLNHFYLISLLGFVWLAVPAHRTWSLDARLRPRPGDGTAPAWSLWLMRFMVALPYVFGGVAKLNADWLRGEPLRMWLADYADWPVAGPWLASEPAVWFFAGGGLALDLLVVPGLLWKRTRAAAFVASLLFHGMNSALFDIGIFPWMMIAATTVFFDPGWPRRLRLLRGPDPEVPAGDPSLTLARRAWLAALGLWAALHVLVPFRHILYPGNVAWTEEGHKFSWRMKLRDKRTTGEFTVRDPATGKTWKVDPRAFLLEHQARKFMDWPDMVHLFCRHVAERESKRTGRRVEVRARVMCSLNGREARLLVDPEVDLGAEPREILGRAEWIMPMGE
jgi:hypothetical protein